MPNWKWKALLQKAISFLPYPHRINTLFQRHLTRGLDLTEGHFTDKVSVAGDHLRFLHRHHPNVREPVCLELGTGWYPVVPLALFLSGCGAVHTLDIASHLRKANLGLVMERLLGMGPDQLKARYLPRLKEERWREMEKLYRRFPDHDLSTLLGKLNIHPRVGDARHLPFPDRSFDFIGSNNTFEHIYPDVLSDILREFRRVIRDDGIMSHFIDMTDHFEHFDRSISIYHFLRFPERAWKRIDNTIQPQNRLRFPDYRQLYRRAGFAILDQALRPGQPELLKDLPLDAAFRNYSLEELAISHAHLVGTPVQSGK